MNNTLYTTLYTIAQTVTLMAFALWGVKRNLSFMESILSGWFLQLGVAALTKHVGRIITGEPTLQVHLIPLTAVYLAAVTAGWYIVNRVREANTLPATATPAT